MSGYSLSDFEAVLAIGRKASFRAAAVDLRYIFAFADDKIARLEIVP